MKIDGNAPAFALTTEQISTLIRSALSAELEARRGAPPALVDRNGIALALGCSASLVDKLRQKGMPYLRLGESPRFEIEACLAWLRQQKGANS